MEETIVFCADGHLRVMLSEKQPLVPLVAFRDMDSYADDYSFMSRWWGNEVIFEDGLTVAKFLACLQPWQKFWSIYTNKNVGAYIAESKLPTLVKEEDEGKEWYACLYYASKFNLETKSNKNFDDFEDMNDYFNDRTPASPTPFYDLEAHYSFVGYVKGENEQYSIDHTPVNEMANYPLILNPYHLIDIDNRAHNIDQEVVPLFNENAFGIRTAVETFDERTYTTKYVLCKKKHILREVVDAFFWWFASTPAKREAFNEQLKNDIDAIDLAEKKVENDVYEEIVKDEEAQTDGTKKIVIAEGAFDGVTSYWEAQDKHFKEALAYASEHTDVPIKIGTVNSQKMPEKRIYRKIVDDVDIYL